MTLNLTLKRLNSTAQNKASEAAGKAKDAAGRATQTAQEVAGKATQAASEAAGKAADAASRYAGGVGERLNHYFGAYRGPVIYNSQVLLNVFKQVYRTEKMAPPTSLHEIQSAYKTLFDRAKSMPYWQDLWTSGQWKTVAIGGLEIYGIFKIGEIIGRRSIVGYKLD